MSLIRSSLVQPSLCKHLTPGINSEIGIWDLEVGKKS